MEIEDEPVELTFMGSNAATTPDRLRFTAPDRLRILIPLLVAKVCDPIAPALNVIVPVPVFEI